MCSADTERLAIARQELHAMLEEDELKEAMLLVFANKQDQKGSLRAKEVCIPVEECPHVFCGMSKDEPRYRMHLAS